MNKLNQNSINRVDKKIQTTLQLDWEVRQTLDAKRGVVERSLYANYILRKALGLPVEVFRAPEVPQ